MPLPGGHSTVHYGISKGIGFLVDNRKLFISSSGARQEGAEDEN
jgi:hypothetical protein